MTSHRNMTNISFQNVNANCSPFRLLLLHNTSHYTKNCAENVSQSSSEINLYYILLFLLKQFNLKQKWLVSLMFHFFINMDLRLHCVAAQEVARGG